MKVIVEGNMASGKTLYSKLLCKALPLQHISMDNIRMEFWKTRTMTVRVRERESRCYLKKWILTCKGYVYERIGAGAFDSDMDKFLEAVDIPRILIHTPPRICLQRFETRECDRKMQVLLPDYMNDYEEYIYYVDDYLAAKRKRGDYAMVIENGELKTKNQLKREVLRMKGMLEMKPGGIHL
jgi:adenylate kinase family enzyme